MTTRSLCYILLGYLSGSVLFAKLALALLGKEDALRDSCDENPGTANAFQCGGLLCGLMTLSGDLLKGYLPLRLYLAPDRVLLLRQPVFALVLLAPVLGTVLPVFSHFRGGKGITVTFGCLLGLFPECRPLLAFTGSFLLFTLVIEITPNFYRTMAAYVFAMPLLRRIHVPSPVLTGFLLITVTVCLRLHYSPEKREKVKVKLPWKH